jgi:hypothetical protein
MLSLNKKKKKIMKKITQLSLIVTLTSLFSLSYAEYQAVIGTANHNIKFVQWEDTTSIEGEWVNKSAPYDCKNWAPTVDSQNQGMTFTQTATDCKQDQERQVQLRSKDKISGVIIVKDTILEQRVNTGQTSTQSAVGTKLLKECRFAKINPSGSGAANYYVLETGGNTWAYWNGEQMGFINFRAPTYVFINNGYRYYSTQLMVTDWYYYHNICKEKI